MTARLPSTAMVLAAGRGLRMRPITETLPKPLVPVAGRPLIDWGLDSLAAAGVARAVVNVHHLGEQVAAHVGSRKRPEVTVSDERDELLDSAGGIVKALPLLGSEPFFVLNADTFWVADNGANLPALADAWDEGRMDILLMLAEPGQATGHTGKTDFLRDETGRLVRAAGAGSGSIYAGAAIVHPRIFAGATAQPHSLNLYFDRAIAAGRLFGLPMQGAWITVGTPDGLAAAEAAIARMEATAS
ncbi:nucleotidyltransferase family protein [Mesorhizobium xinjiangense]|uniref:nucleotidyltransferase family protein n=1 Tax=Mesorhizobium xinjiangense TaxID=2678685 RepID=UPI0012EE2038|nr:nucleotidyltransferase family protein [Mesorhizobium xinjiangense]